MEIIAKCKYDLDAVKALIHQTMFKKRDPKKILVFWSVLCPIVLLLIGVDMIAFGPDACLWVLLGAEILGMSLIYFSYFITPRIQYHSLAKMQNVENRYIFCDHVMKAFTTSQVYNGQAEIEYTLFLKAYETSRYLFLYQTRKQIFIVDKNTIEGGTVEDLRNLLSAVLKDKYFLCAY